MVVVRLFATLREGRGKEVAMEWEIGMSPKRVILSLNIEEKDVSILLVNGMDATLDTELADNDIVAIFPPVGGG